MLVVLMGPPCSGKTELANHIAATYGYKTIDLRIGFRKALEGEEAKIDKKQELELFYTKKYQGLVMKVYEEALKVCYSDYPSNAVIYPVTTFEQLSMIKDRKFILSFSLTSRFEERYKHFCKKHYEITVEEFLELDDKISFGLNGCTSLSSVMKLADKAIENNRPLEELRKKWTDESIVKAEKFRPGWDTYFMLIASLVSKRSNCFRRAVGAIVVKDYKIIATGYNGAPFGIKNCNQGGCPRCVGAKVVGKDLDKCVCIHAEENAVVEAGRVKAKGASLYTTTFPCLFCSKVLIQAGIKKLYYHKEYDMGLPKKLLEDGKVELIHLKMEGLGDFLKL